MEAIERALKANPKGAGYGLVAISAAGVLAISLRHSFFSVDGGHRALVFSRFSGVGNKVYREGIHFRIPWLHRPIVYDVRTRAREIRSPTGNLQMINIGIRVLSRPNSEYLPVVYRTLGMNWDERVLPSIVHETVKSVVARFNASQLITQRQLVSDLIRKQLAERAEDFNIILDDVSITELSFSPVYSAAVEAKQVAAQDTQRAAYLVEKAKQERAQKIIQAEGEANAAKMLGQSMAQDAGYIKLRKLNASKNIAKTISQSTNKIYMNAGALMTNLSDPTFFGFEKSILKRR